MSKLNKQEKEYAVRRIQDEISKVINEKLGPSPELIDRIRAVRDTVDGGTAKLLPTKEIMEMVSNALHQRWGSQILASDLVADPPEYRKRCKEIDKYNEAYNQLKEKLNKAAQPLIDEIQLGQADAAKISEIAEILRA